MKILQLMSYSFIITMNKKLILQDLRSLLIPLSYWTLILSFSFIIMMLIYPSYIKYEDTLKIIFESYPKITLEALGINLDTCFTPIGYYCLIFKYLSILFAIMASNFGIKIIKQSDQDQILYTMPLKRSTIITSKIIALAIIIFIINLIYELISIIVMMILTKANILILTKINLGLLLIQINFACITMMIASFIKNKRILNLTGYLCVLFFYILDQIQNITKLKFLRYINPFSLFKPSDILNNNHYTKGFFIASIFIIFYTINFCYIHNNELEM